MDLIMEPDERPPPPPSTSVLQPRPGSRNSHRTRLKPEPRDRSGLLSELQHFLSDPKEPHIGPPQEQIKYSSLQHISPLKADNVPGVQRQPPRPRIDKLLFRSGANWGTPEDALSSVDGEDYSLDFIVHLSAHEQKMNWTGLTQSGVLAPSVTFYFIFVAMISSSVKRTFPPKLVPLAEFHSFLFQRSSSKV